MWLSRRDGNELFNRVREVEKSFAVNEEHNKNIEELFINHDKQEMIKYDKIQKKLDILFKFQYIAIGALILFEFLHKLGYLSL